ncbi:class I SAM-dependent DNA methyltransferase [Shimia abyssi]|uniref:Methyltransferase family protein n=1 Tax=Shimia abyssi TaxID=1662395 RepID=A0A2P8F9H4_9RHOB|nr:class I SAM-dependent methyltransferase [Shimia abyssi]PSL18377.1 methyltransferase family protein [Shimia abyssi]
MCPKNSPSLDAAYSLETPQDSVRLYADWADTYDSNFAQSSDYILPAQVAHHFAVSGGNGPILDVGAGTGLCAVELAKYNVGPIDATDISPDMLEIARTKSLYHALIVADLTKSLPIPDATYCGIVSSGTFTNGHVGPDAFDELVRITRPGGLLVLSINAQHFAAAGFEAKLAGLSTQISDLTLTAVRFYGPNSTGPHKDDTGFLATFRRAPD